MKDCPVQKLKTHPIQVCIRVILPKWPQNINLEVCSEISIIFQNPHFSSTQKHLSRNLLKSKIDCKIPINTQSKFCHFLFIHNLIWEERLRVMIKQCRDLWTFFLLLFQILLTKINFNQSLFNSLDCRHRLPHSTKHVR